MGEDAHLAVAKDRNGRFSGYYKCSLCNAEFRPNPKHFGEMAVTFAAHVRLSHPFDKTTREDANQTAAQVATQEASEEAGNK